jgi:hypothetical protein
MAKCQGSSILIIGLYQSQVPGTFAPQKGLDSPPLECCWFARYYLRCLAPLDRQIQGFGGGSGDPAGAEWDNNTQGGERSY